MTEVTPLPAIEPAQRIPIGHQPVENLASSIQRFVKQPDWDGVPNSGVLATALRILIIEGARDGQALTARSIGLLETVIEALEGGTQDGWRVELIGRQGTKKTFEYIEQKLEIAHFVDEEIQRGSGYESALAAAKAKFECGRSTAAEAYSDFIRIKRRWESGLKSTIKRLEEELQALRLAAGTPPK